MATTGAKVMATRPQRCRVVSRAVPMMRCAGARSFSRSTETLVSVRTAEAGGALAAVAAHMGQLSLDTKTKVRREVSTRAAADAVVDTEAEEVGGEEGQKFATAYLKGLRMGPNKVRRVVDTIRGRSYEEALMILEFMPYRACEPVLKLLYSAASNAKNNYGLSKSKLVVSEVKVDMGKHMKRARIGGRARIKPYKKFGSHVFIKLEEMED